MSNLRIEGIRIGDQEYVASVTRKPGKKARIKVGRVDDKTGRVDIHKPQKGGHFIGTNAYVATMEDRKGKVKFGLGQVLTGPILLEIFGDFTRVGDETVMYTLKGPTRLYGTHDRIEIVNDRKPPAKVTILNTEGMSLDRGFPTGEEITVFNPNETLLK